MKYIYSALILLIALALAAFIQQNGQPVALKYFNWTTQPLPLSLFVILAFAGGYLLAVVVGFSTGIRSKVRTAGAEREVRKLRSEVEELRGREKGQEGAASPSTSRSAASGEGTGAFGPDPMKGVSAEALTRALGEEEES